MKLLTKNIYLLFTLLIFYSLPCPGQLSTQTCFKPGADRPALYLPLLKNKAVAVVTNQTALLQDKTHLVDFLARSNINIKSIMAPEHGFRGTADAGEHVHGGTDPKTGIPIVSLYGDNKKPTAAQLQDVDVILFDIQDVGVRFYTYISTLALVMEAAAENQKPVIILDRPNPHDGYTDGPILEDRWKSFVGMHTVPVVYGLTIGEYGRMLNGERWLKNGVTAKLTVIPMLNYHKKQRYGVPDRPSPNLPNDRAINLYPSLCFFEGTQVSVGRGTAFPFQVYGSPWTKKLPFQFTPTPAFGAKNPFLNGQLCYGEDLTATTEELRRLNLSWLLRAYRNYKHTKEPFFTKNLWFDKLAGTDQLRRQITEGKSEEEIRQSWKPGLEAFEKIRSKYRLYED